MPHDARMPSLRATWCLALAFVAAIVHSQDARTTDRGVPDLQTFASVRGCDVGYRVHAPRASQNRDAVAVIIAHGFLRDGDSMRGWAQAIADTGITAVTTDLCASASPGGQHADNATDLVALRRRLGIERAIYMGVSAGGLAALIAASQDATATQGLLLLDPTNAGGPARSAASRVHAPTVALVSRPQPCNAWRNIDPALRTLSDATIVRMGHVSHCDFEWPSDRFCRIACATWNADPPAAAQSRIRAIALSFVAAVARSDGESIARWKSELATSLGLAAPLDDEENAREATPAPIR